MSTFRVYEVAEELGVESSQLIGILREMEVPVRSHMSVVDEGQIARLHARLERERRTGSAAPASRSEASPRRRRRRVKPEPIELLLEDVAPAEEAIEGELPAESMEAPVAEAEVLEEAELELEIAPEAEGEQPDVRLEIDAEPAAEVELAEPQEVEVADCVWCDQMKNSNMPWKPVLVKPLRLLVMENSLSNDMLNDLTILNFNY